MNNLHETKTATRPVSENAVRRGILGKANGQRLEQEVRRLLELEQSSHLFSSQPDILDFKKGVIGEIKSAKSGYRVVLYVDQIKRYLKLAEELSTTALSNSEMKNFEVFYFVAFYEKVFKTMTDIYKLDRQKLEALLESDTSNTNWNIVDKKILRELHVLRDRSQTFLNEAPKNELTTNILRKNRRGEYIQIGIRELDKLCPNTSDSFNGSGVKIHW